LYYLIGCIDLALNPIPLYVKKLISKNWLASMDNLRTFSGEVPGNFILTSAKNA